MAPALEPMVGRYVRLEIEGVAASPLFRGGGPRHPAGLPAHCRRRQSPVSPSARRSRDHAPLPRARVRPAVARQVDAARRLGARRVPAHDAVLHRRDPRLLRGHGARQAGRHGLLDRRAHRAQSRDRACRGVPRPDRARGRRLPAAVVRHELAAPARRPWRRGLRRAGLRPDRAAQPAGQPPRDAVDVHAGRPRRVQRRSVFLSRRRRPAREGEGRSTRRSARSTC